VNFSGYKSNSWLHAGHFALSLPGWPKMNILPIVLHMGHIPVVTFFGPVLMIFWVFRLPIIKNGKHRILNLIVEFRLQYCFFKKYRHKFSNFDIICIVSQVFHFTIRGIQTLRDKMINHFVFGRAGFPQKNETRNNI